VYRMGKVLTAIEDYSKQLQASRHDTLLGSPTICVGMIHGGASPNTVPDHCSISIDRRLLPGETAWEAIAHLTQFLSKHREILEYHVTDPSFACPALVPRGGEAFIQRLGSCIDAVKGSHTLDSVPYGTDASTVQEAGIPAVVFGPGDIAQAHTKDEWVELAQVEQAAEVLFRFATG
jgi:acetylornithine deacetylase/succinyl-diaminopimelate desuccinylase-like protein